MPITLTFERSTVSNGHQSPSLHLTQLTVIKAHLIVQRYYRRETNGALTRKRKRGINRVANSTSPRRLQPNAGSKNRPRSHPWPISLRSFLLYTIGADPSISGARSCFAPQHCEDFAIFSGLFVEGKSQLNRLAIWRAIRPDRLRRRRLRRLGYESADR
jgi:hypothetical protein